MNTIANKLLTDQKEQSFDCLVLGYSAHVGDEKVLSHINAPVYEAIWTFHDGSKVLLKNFIFEGCI